MGISLISQRGKSDFVCSDDMTVGLALQKATDLQKALERDEHLETFTPNVDDPEELTVHKAMGILHNRLLLMNTIDAKEYYSAGDMTAESLVHFVDPLLYKSIVWLTDHNLFLQAADATATPKPAVLSIVCDLIHQSNKIMTPKHL